jgi:1-acyl-sn-glycerol-3-phosphate acyltransferase
MTRTDAGSTPTTGTTGGAPEPASKPAAAVANVEAPYAERPTILWKLAQVLVRLWSTVWFDLKVWGIRNVPRTGGVLIVSNHQSYLDPPILGARIPRPMSYMAKSELFEHRVLAMLIRSLGAFPVRQGAGDVRAIKETVHRLQEGRVLNIFPEGSRTETGEIMPLEPGVALVARKAGVPIVPAAMIGSYEAWPKGKKMFHRHPIRLVFGPPLDVKGMKSEQVLRLIDSAIRKLYDGLRSGRMNEEVAAQPWEKTRDRS